MRKLKKLFIGTPWYDKLIAGIICTVLGIFILCISAIIIYGICTHFVEVGAALFFILFIIGAIYLTAKYEL